MELNMIYNVQKVDSGVMGTNSFICKQCKERNIPTQDFIATIGWNDRERISMVNDNDFKYIDKSYIISIQTKQQQIGDSCRVY